MKRIQIPVELSETAIEIYQQVQDNGQEDSVAVKRIQELLKERNLEYSDRSVYRLLQEWKKSGQVRSLIESFDVDLSSPYRRTEYILSVLEGELKKSVDENEPANKKIRLADSMHKYIETEIKIEVLRSKKTITSKESGVESSRIVINEDE